MVRERARGGGRGGELDAVGGGKGGTEKRRVRKTEISREKDGAKEKRGRGRRETLVS